ncbi:hypothetical protein JL2886_00289 [Phaeobacter gallaeciensis]|uniref:Uncharacterized protein n=1 Tax=Phaeobacter gallaeciensis TaxID=60890 RepID=A0A1B0ZM25_9RHOB|nr:hypothetical protein JL2886_00289 [Phaeobacter gallaeciensis]
MSSLARCELNGCLFTYPQAPLRASCAIAKPCCRNGCGTPLRRILISETNS